MPPLNWPVFETLPGAQTTNWQTLCRELVRRNYQQYGVLRELAQQEGVEFHLQVGTDCSLGERLKHWGWQCRWYGLPAGKQIGASRRQKIEAAIRSTAQAIPGLTDWVLWTRRPLTPTDQKWFYNIVSPFTLRLWNEEDVIGLLNGEAEVLRYTYFGDLVLTNAKFEQLHSEAIAPIQKRWEPQLHVEVGVERALKAVLGGPGTWPILRETGERMAQRATLLKSESSDLEQVDRDRIDMLCSILSNQSLHLMSLAEAVDACRLGDVRRQLRAIVPLQFTRRDLGQLGVRLRSQKHPSSISVAMAQWESRNYFLLLKELSEQIDQNLVAVVGDAALGKTYLAAELTKPTPTFPGGIFLQGKHLSATGTLDELLKRVSFGGERFGQLLEALDAAGARAGRRLPVVIDGLNESENPRVWKELLSALRVQLDRFNHCVVVLHFPRM